MVTFYERIGCLSLNFVKIIAEHAIAEHVTRVQGQKVKYSNHNNSAVDCTISLKFCNEFHMSQAIQ